MKLLTWIKSLSWIAIAGAIGAAIMMILNARRAGMLEAQVSQKEKEILVLNAETNVDLFEAARLQGQITATKIRARAARKRAEKHQERIGQDETMADIAKRFNGKRVRSRADTAAEL